jgi:hypothetical protein
VSSSAGEKKATQLGPDDLELMDRAVGLPEDHRQLLLRILAAMHFGDAESAINVKRVLRAIKGGQLTPAELGALLPKLPQSRDDGRFSL